MLPARCALHSPTDKLFVPLTGHPIYTTWRTNSEYRKMVGWFLYIPPPLKTHGFVRKTLVVDFILQLLEMLSCELPQGIVNHVGVVDAQFEFETGGVHFAAFCDAGRHWPLPWPALHVVD